MTGKAVDWRIILWVAITIVTLWFLYQVRGILLPFVIAILISALLGPAFRWLKAKGWRDLTAAGVPMLLFFGVLAVAMLSLAPVISNQVGSLKDRTEVLVASLAKPDPLDNFFLRGNPANRQKQAEKKAKVLSTSSMR